ncbi:unnamed protein product [Prorocentrum cordatum]|uniref:Uncharacterized protein n=1 Tax=Prorocentrum cordatum TaxID=2364126 RepID=A0ABN9V9D1_9DINO|nr:unnamed protein product [Polarella glacialis]
MQGCTAQAGARAPKALAASSMRVQAQQHARCCLAGLLSRDSAHPSLRGGGAGNGTAGTSNERRAGGGERPPFKTRPAKWRRQPPGARLPTKVRAKKPKCPPPPASESGGGKAGKATRMVFQTVCVFQACECRKTPGVSSDRDTPWGRPTGQRDTDGGKPWRPSKKIHAVGSPDQLGGKKRQYRSSSDLR